MKNKRKYEIPQMEVVMMQTDELMLVTSSGSVSGSTGGNGPSIGSGGANTNPGIEADVKHQGVLERDFW
ncbi:MAG: hypothetical protein II222_04875 [Paraprevotella sp.]|nr:hypothetical protein [Paraprevotella sp.]